MANPAVVVDFVANTKDLQKGFNQASGKASGFGSKLKGLALGAATAGFAALGAAVKVGIGEFADAQKIGAQTDAVIKSTGGAAKVTAQQVSDLAGALMKKSGVDDEVIQSGENVLLTFTNIRNEAGKGNDVFDQTTKAALDMSVALGTDMKTASMQLGKALNDPVKGMTKLTRAGVTFTDAQKKQVDAMVKAGDTAGAQKLILAELNKEFGGSAEAAGKTLPGQLNILKQQFNNLAGAIVGKFVPPLTAAAKLLASHKNVVVAVAGVLVTLTAATLAVSAATAAWNALQIAAQVASKAWAAAQWLVNIALSANPIGLVVVAIAALVAALIIAYKTSDTFRAVVNRAFTAVWNVIKAVFNWIKGNWPTLLAILTGPIGLATLVIARNWTTIRNTTLSAVNAVKGIVTSAWSTVKAVTTAAWNAVSSKVGDVVHDVKTALNAFATWIKGFANGALTSAVNAVKSVWKVVGEAAEDAVHSVKTAFNDLLRWLSGLVSSVSTEAGKIAHALKSPINAVISAWNSLGIPRVQFTIPGLKIKGHTIFGSKTVGFGPFAFPDIKQLAKGGIVTGPTLALVGEAGPEAVVPLDRMPAPSVQVRVFIGETELTQLVRTEIVDANTGLARTLLAGGTG